MIWVYILLLSFTTTLGCRSSKEKYFSNTWWGSWRPTDNKWEDWIKIWGQNNSSVNFDSTEVGKDPKSGWPRYWKELGFGNSGVSPPPWSYIPENYGRAGFCYLNPNIGNCDESFIRWAFNSTSDDCESFEYSGCGGNENNFMQKYDCKEACGRVPSTGCDSGWVKFKKYIKYYE